LKSPWSTEVLRTDSPELFSRAVHQAAFWLRAGEVVAVPTETVYGLAANALNPIAVNRLFEVKGRPASNPIIVHVDSVPMGQRCVRVWTKEADQLASKFWPGPLTLVLERASVIPDRVTAGGSTVGLRSPRHGFMHALIQACGFPLAAPSANLSGQISPTQASHVMRGLSGRIPLVIDGGAAAVGIESTVVDLVSDPPRILRPGMIDMSQLRQVLPALQASPASVDGCWRSPGMMAQHYAPQARLLVLDWKDTPDLERQLSHWPMPRESVHVIAHDRVPEEDFGGRVVQAPRDADGFARFIFAALHRCDEEGAGLIVVERLPEGPAWHGIQDRLQRASAK
jgi:L-threonylcarbamoyladenylate synthase